MDLVPQIVDGFRAWVSRPLIERVCRCGQTWSLSAEPSPVCMGAPCCGTTLEPVGQPAPRAVPHRLGATGMCAICGCSRSLLD